MLSKKNVVITEYLVDMLDQQRGLQQSTVDLDEKVHQLVQSCRQYAAPVVLLTNQDVQSQTEGLTIESMAIQPQQANLGMYFLRWQMVYDYLLQHPELHFIALVDASDVEMLNFPFDDLEEGTLYFGDELNDLTSYIVQGDSKPDYLEQFVWENPTVQLLNSGVILGDRRLLLQFVGDFMLRVSEDERGKLENPDAPHLGNFEMGLMNYVAYKDFSDVLFHGRQVTTRFLEEERQVTSWFKHK